MKIFQSKEGETKHKSVRLLILKLNQDIHGNDSNYFMDVRHLANVHTLSCF